MPFPLLFNTEHVVFLLFKNRETITFVNNILIIIYFLLYALVFQQEGATFLPSSYRNWLISGLFFIISLGFYLLIFDKVDVNKKVLMFFSLTSSFIFLLFACNRPAKDFLNWLFVVIGAFLESFYDLAYLYHHYVHPLGHILVSSGCIGTVGELLMVMSVLNNLPFSQALQPIPENK